MTVITVGGQWENVEASGMEQGRGDPEQEGSLAREGAAKWLLTSSV